MRILALSSLLLLLSACAHAPSSSSSTKDDNNGYGYTEHFFAENPANVQKATTSLFRELIQGSSPKVPGEVREGESSAATGWVYFTEAGRLIRRRYQANLVNDGNGTLVILALDEERKYEENWQPVVPVDTTYQAFFSRLQTKIRRLR